MEKILHLKVKKKWFDMIDTREKPEEYRDLTPYWAVRLLDIKYPFEERCSLSKLCEDICFDFNRHDPYTVIESYYSTFKNFDAVKFYNGGSPSLKYPNFQIGFKGIEIREGKPEWGAEPGKKYFVIKLGDIITK